MKKQFRNMMIAGIIFLIATGVQAQVYYSGCTPTSSKQASAIGLNASSSGNQSFASGNYARATGNYTTALGSYVQATAANSFTFGSGTSAGGYLTNATANSLLLGFSNKPVLFAQLYGSGTARVGIGTNVPAYTLDVNGNAGFTNAYTNNIYFPGSEFNIIKTGDGPDMKYTKTILSAKQNGNVGIGTTAPDARLHVNGSIKAQSMDIAQDGKMRKVKLTGVLLSDPEFRPLQYLEIGDQFKINSYQDNYGLSYSIGVNTTNRVQLESYISFTNNSILLRSMPVSSNSYTDFYITDNSVRITSQKFRLDANSHFNGKVGIQTTDPQYPLHVTGVSYMNGNTHITGNVGIGSAPSSAYELGVNGKIGCKEIVVTNTGWADYVFEPDYKLRPLDELESFILENRHLPEIPSAAHVEENGIGLFEMNALLLKKVEELTLYILEQNKRIESLEKTAETK